MPPWKLVGGTKLLWYVRLEVIRELDAKRLEIERRKSKTRNLDQINAEQKRRR